MSMKPIDGQDRRVANIHRDEFEVWETGGVDRGESVLQLNGNEIGRGFHVYKMAPGTTSMPHEHMSDEEFFMISGELVDHDGTVYREGDLVWLKKGTQHSSYTKDGCVIAVYIQDPEAALPPEE